VYLTRPVLGNYAASQEEIAWRAGDVLRWISEGRLKIRIDRTVPLEDAAQVHRVLEARQTVGKVLLLI
jgi:NADPH2:quinone reductase